MTAGVRLGMDLTDLLGVSVTWIFSFVTTARSISFGPMNFQQHLRNESLPFSSFPLCPTRNRQTVLDAVLLGLLRIFKALLIYKIKAEH